MFLLVQKRSAPVAQTDTVEVPRSVQFMLDSLNLPAYVMTVKWDVVAWNQLACKVFRNYDAMAPHERNIIRILLTGPEFLADPQEHEIIVRRVLSKLRYDFSQASDDPEFVAFIDNLHETSAMFRRLWPSAQISTRSEGAYAYPHAKFGAIAFEHSSYVIEGEPFLRLIIFAPCDEGARHALESIGGGLQDAFAD
jgi:hypothetical protein